MPPSRTGPKSQSDAGPGSQHSLNDPQRLVFIDETGASTKMAQMRGHALQGERCRAAVSHGHWKTTTFTGALRLDGITAPMVLDDPMNRVAFQAYIEQGSCPGYAGVTPSSRTTCPPTKVRRCAEPSRQPERPATLLTRLQPDRDRLSQAQGVPAESGRTHHRRPMGCHSRRGIARITSPQLDMR